MSEKRIQYKIQVRGRVQGVGFRQSCMKEARFRGISGFVKNMNDGSVYIEGEGEQEQLNELVEWCKKSPGYGFVEDVSVETGIPANHIGFSILY
jgi:acylphosphatase